MKSQIITKIVIAIISAMVVALLILFSPEQEWASLLTLTIAIGIMIRFFAFNFIDALFDLFMFFYTPYNALELPTAPFCSFIKNQRTIRIVFKALFALIGIIILSGIWYDHLTKML